MSTDLNNPVNDDNVAGAGNQNQQHAGSNDPGHGGPEKSTPLVA